MLMRYFVNKKRTRLWSCSKSVGELQKNLTTILR